MHRHSLLVLGLAASAALAAGCHNDHKHSSRADASGSDANYPDTSVRVTEPYTAPGGSQYTSRGEAYDPYASARTASERQGMGPVSPADKAFLVTLSGSNKAEIAAAELALRKSDNAQVQQFARQIIQDHRDAEDRVQQLSRSKGVDLDASIPQDARSASWELSKLEGTTFDRQYFAVNHASHMKTLAAVQHAAQMADDPEIRQLAQQILPKIQQHAQMSGQNMGRNTRGMQNNTNYQNTYPNQNQNQNQYPNSNPNR